MPSNLDAAFGYPHTASAVTFTPATAAVDVTLTSGSWYEMVSSIPIKMTLGGTAVTTATTALGAYVPGNTVYNFFTGNYPYMSVISPYASAGVGAIWPKRVS